MEGVREPREGKGTSTTIHRAPKHSVYKREPAAWLLLWATWRSTRTGSLPGDSHHSEGAMGWGPPDGTGHWSSLLPLPLASVPDALKK